MSTLIGSPPKNKKSKRVPLCNINCKNLALYLDVPEIYIVHISLEDRGASGSPPLPPQKKVSNPGLSHYRLAVVLGWE